VNWCYQNAGAAVLRATTSVLAFRRDQRVMLDVVDRPDRWKTKLSFKA